MLYVWRADGAEGCGPVSDDREHLFVVGALERPLLKPPRWTWPLPATQSGVKPRISDGRHTRADKAAGRSGRVHRGVDIMYRRKLPANARKAHPWGSKWYYIPQNVPTPCLAAFDGVVIAAGIIKTGGVVFLDHGDGVGTAYHHLRGVLVGEHTFMSQGHALTPDAVSLGVPDIRIGEEIKAGKPVGVVGGSPVGYGLAHNHFDKVEELDVEASTLGRGRLAGSFQDPAKDMRGWDVVHYDVAWGDVGRVG